MPCRKVLLFAAYHKSKKHVYIYTSSSDIKCTHRTGVKQISQTLKRKNYIFILIFD